jgi:MFS family permease
MRKKLHPAWTALVVTFLTLMATAGFRSAPSVLIVPLEDAFGWSRSQISLAIAINVMLYGLVAPFAAALMERFTVRKVVVSALSFVAISSGSTIFMTQPWHLWALWGVCIGVGTGSMALVFAATIANRWFIARKGIVVGALTAAVDLLATAFSSCNDIWMEERLTYCCRGMLSCSSAHLLLP